MNYFLLQKDLKSKKHLITAMTIETTILDFQLSNTFEQYESYMNAEEQQSMFKEMGVKTFSWEKYLDFKNKTQKLAFISIF